MSAHPSTPFWQTQEQETLHIIPFLRRPQQPGDPLDNSHHLESEPKIYTPITGFLQWKFRFLSLVPDHILRPIEGHRSNIPTLRRLSLKVHKRADNIHIRPLSSMEHVVTKEHSGLCVRFKLG